MENLKEKLKDIIEETAYKAGNIEIAIKEAIETGDLTHNNIVGIFKS